MTRPTWLAPLPQMTGPRYLAITDCLAAALQAGALRPGDRLPRHRDLASRLGLNVSTVTRFAPAACADSTARRTASAMIPTSCI